MHMPGTIDSLKKVLTQIQQAQDELVEESGHIKQGCKYRYKYLVQKSLEFRDAITQLEDWKYNDGWDIT
jgi:hypothetical protein